MSNITQNTQLIAASALTPPTIVSVFITVPPDVLVAAFAGAALYLVTSTRMPKWKLTVYFIVSFLSGVLAAQFTSKLIAAIVKGFTGTNIDVDAAIGALVAAFCAIQLLTKFRAKAVNSNIGGPPS